MNGSWVNPGDFPTQRLKKEPDFDTEHFNDL